MIRDFQPSGQSKFDWRVAETDRSQLLLMRFTDQGKCCQRVRLKSHGRSMANVTIFLTVHRLSDVFNRVAGALFSERYLSLGLADLWNMSIGIVVGGVPVSINGIAWADLPSLLDIADVNHVLEAYTDEKSICSILTGSLNARVDDRAVVGDTFIYALRYLIADRLHLVDKGPLSFESREDLIAAVTDILNDPKRPLRVRDIAEVLGTIDAATAV
jgi:hypothetical protein